MGILSQTICLATFFMLLFTGYLSFQNIITHLYQQLNQPNLGKIGLFTNYASFMIGGLFAPFVGRKVNYKSILIVASVCYTLNFSSGLILSFTNFATVVIVIVLVMAVIGGCSAGFLWTAQAAYIHYICQKNNLQPKKGYYFGLCYGIFCVSNITSGLMTTFLLGFFSTTVYFWTLFGIGVLATLFCIFFVKNVQKVYGDDEQPLIQKQTPKQSACQAALGVLKFYPKMAPLLSSIGLVGISIAFYASSLHNLLIKALPADADENYINLRTGIMFIILGVGQILGGYFSGRLSDKLGIRKVGAIALSTYFLSCIFTQLADTYYETVVFVMIAAFCWGLQQAYIQNWIVVVCSRNYKGALEGFVINKQFHSFTLCVYEIILILVKPSFTALLPVLYLLGIPCLISLAYIKDEKQQTNSKEEHFRPNIQSIESQRSQN